MNYAIFKEYTHRNKTVILQGSLTLEEAYKVIKEFFEIDLNNMADPDAFMEENSVNYIVDGKILSPEAAAQLDELKDYGYSYPEDFKSYEDIGDGTRTYIDEDN